MRVSNPRQGLAILLHRAGMMRKSMRQHADWMPGSCSAFFRSFSAFTT